MKKNNNEAKVKHTDSLKKARNDRKHHIKIEHNLKFEEMKKEWDGFSSEEKSVLRYKRKWQKFLRWNIRNKRNAKKNNTSDTPVVQKTYNMLVQYDKHLTDQVKNAIDDVKKETWFKKPNIITDIYFYVKDIDFETVEKFKKLFGSVTCTIENHTYKVHVQAMIAKHIVKKERKNKKPTNNTIDRKLRSKVIRKLKNLRKFDVLESLEKGNMSLTDAASWATGKGHKADFTKRLAEKTSRKAKKTTKQLNPSPVGKKPRYGLKKRQIGLNLKSNVEKKAA